MKKAVVTDAKKIGILEFQLKASREEYGQIDRVRKQLYAVVEKQNKNLEKVRAENRALVQANKIVTRELEIKSKAMERVKIDLPKSASAYATKHIERLERILAQVESDLRHEKKQAQEAEFLALQVTGAFCKIPRWVRRIFIKADYGMEKGGEKA